MKERHLWVIVYYHRFGMSNKIMGCWGAICMMIWRVISGSGNHLLLDIIYLTIYSFLRSIIVGIVKKVGGLFYRYTGKAYINIWEHKSFMNTWVSALLACEDVDNKKEKKKKIRTQKKEIRKPPERIMCLKHASSP